MVVWLTGKSGAGKSTLGRALVRELQQESISATLIDGDCDVPQSDIPAGNHRCASAFVAVHLAVKAFYALQKFKVVVCAACSSFVKQREVVRDALSYPSFMEVHVDCDAAELKQRDPHGHYTHQMSEGRRQELDFYENSDAVEMRVNTTKEDEAQTVTRVMQHIRKVLKGS